MIHGQMTHEEEPESTELCDTSQDCCTQIFARVTIRNLLIVREEEVPGGVRTMLTSYAGSRSEVCKISDETLIIHLICFDSTNISMPAQDIIQCDLVLMYPPFIIPPSQLKPTRYLQVQDQMCRNPAIYNHSTLIHSVQS